MALSCECRPGCTLQGRRIRIALTPDRAGHGVYVLSTDVSAEVQARAPNALAGALAGVEVRGDALLTSLEYRDSDGLEGLLSTREPCGLPVDEIGRELLDVASSKARERC